MALVTTLGDDRDDNPRQRYSLQKNKKNCLLLPHTGCTSLMLNYSAVNVSVWRLLFLCDMMLQGSATVVHMPPHISQGMHNGSLIYSHVILQTIPYIYYLLKRRSAVARLLRSP